MLARILLTSSSPLQNPMTLPNPSNAARTLQKLSAQAIAGTPAARERASKAGSAVSKQAAHERAKKAAAARHAKRQP